jgi:hypothetical protein
LEGSAICKNLGNVVELWDIDCRAEKGQVRFLQIADPSKKIARLAEKEIPFALNQNTPIW